MIVYEAILRKFQKQKVKYVLVGGIAVNLLGSLRSTADMDMLVEMSNDNLKKIVTILRGQGYRVKQPVDPMGIADEGLRYDWIHNKHMKAFNFYKEDELKEVDIIIESPVSYEEAKKGAQRIKIDGMILPVISINDLIKMKKNTGRDIDKFDIGELKKIKKSQEGQMIFEWESEEEKLIKLMGISPKKKMEWLLQMHEFLRKAFTKKQRRAYQKLRENR